MSIHSSITAERVIAAIQDSDGPCCSNPGFCLACGEDADGCEPDARKYECECCGQRQVYGAEECILMLA